VIETSLYSEGFLTGRRPLQFSGRAIIQGDSKYACYFLGQHREQLFDLATDPGEMVNRAVTSAGHAERDRMRHLLYDFCRRTEDPYLHQVPGHALLSPGAERW
jgi:arylsulfatase A-like enzyme